MLRRLRHNNIVAYRDSFVDYAGDKLCILQEFCRGGDLAGLISSRRRARSRFSEEEVLSIMRGLVKALAYCHHDLKLLHRDLKPQNVFLKDEVVSKGAIDESHIKLGDFGISKMLAASQGLAQTQCGTPLYMSPEMCRGEAYDRAADVWALGCIMYELMTFDAPWLRQMGPRGVNNEKDLGASRRRPPWPKT